MSDPKDLCAICCEEIETPITTLLCGHKYHTLCIKTAYEIEIHKSNFNVPPRKCPYCRQNGGYLELEPNTIPIKWIHKEYNDFYILNETKNIELLKVYLNNSKCFAILKSGINKGKQCTYKQVENGKYCKTHQ